MRAADNEKLYGADRQEADAALVAIGVLWLSNHGGSALLSSRKDSSKSDSNEGEDHGELLVRSR